MPKTLNLAVLLSGSGRTLKNLIDRIGEGSLDAVIKLVISAKSGAYGMERAEEAGIPSFCVDRKKHGNSTDFAEKIYEHIEKQPIDIIILAGFMHLFPVKPGWKNRVMNIHPALIPSFCGKGFYGMKVHEAVMDYGVKISGCTVHFVDGEYDRGPIILQSPVPVKDADTPHTLAERVFREECRLYPEAINLFSGGRIRVEGRRVYIKKDKKDDGK